LKSRIFPTPILNILSPLYLNLSERQTGVHQSFDFEEVAKDEIRTAYKWRPLQKRKRMNGIQPLDFIDILTIT